jgi:hypothetical protein
MMQRRSALGDEAVRRKSGTNHMNGHFAVRIVLLAACMLTAVSLVGCGDDDPVVVPNNAEPSFDNIWPAAVGHHWTYEIVSHTIPRSNDLYATAEEVPPLPSMEELYSALMAKRFYNDPEVYSGAFHLRFAEDISPSTELVAMRLDNETVNIAGHPLPPSPLWLGQVWVRSVNRISYSSAGFVGWVHLNGALTPNHEFSVELPSIVATELSTRIWRNIAYEALGTTYSNCIESFYVLDEGVRREGTAYETQGYFREFAYGVVIYAPELGPVYCHEMTSMGYGAWDNREATIASFANEALGASAVDDHR